MSGKNQVPITFQWQATSPITGFLPLNGQTQGQGSVGSGVTAGAMASTNTIYSQILDVSRMDNLGLEVAWSGTPAGTLTVQASDSGINFSALTFYPALAQPSGAAGKYTINLNQYPYKYILLQYVNSSGSGTLNIYTQNKDLN